MMVTTDLISSCKKCIHYNVCTDEYKNRLRCADYKDEADFVEVETVAKMFAEQFGDCPCNFNGIDEWLPYVCEHNNVCKCSVEAGWEQFIRHYGKRK